MGAHGIALDLGDDGADVGNGSLRALQQGRQWFSRFTGYNS